MGRTIIGRSDRMHIVGGSTQGVSEQGIQENGQWRRQLVQIPPTSVAAGAAAQIPINVTNFCKAKRLVIPSAIAADFDINQIRVGADDQFVGTAGSIPAQCFTEVSMDTWIDFKEFEPGVGVSMNVTNNSAAAVTFSGAFWVLVKR
jgi:hypothetical protein